MKKKVLILSGCMAVQARYKQNIREEEIYPNILREQVGASHGIDLDFEVITYKGLTRWMEIAAQHCTTSQFDLVIFQLRTHDYLNLITYGKTGAIKEDLQLSDSKSKSGIQKLLDHYRRLKAYLITQEKGILIYVLRLLRFASRNIIRPLFLGLNLLKNRQAHAKREYDQLVHNMHAFASTHKIPAVFLGVTSRPNSYFEDQIGKRLNRYLKKQYLWENRYTRSL